MFKQTAHRVLVARLRLIVGDTAVALFGTGTYGSRATMTNQYCIRRPTSCVAWFFEIPAHHLEADEADLEVPEDQIGIRRDRDGDRPAAARGTDPR
jgi:hypothetical protein